MADVRALLKAKRQEARITHPYAAYGASGALRCTACGAAIKFASAWEGHLGSKAHRVAVAKNLKAANATAVSVSVSKRKAEGDGDGDGDGDGGLGVTTLSSQKRQRTEEPDEIVVDDDDDAHASHHPFPQDFFSDPARAPPPPPASDDDDDDEMDQDQDQDGKTKTRKTTATVTTPAPAAPKSQFDMEWAAFERDMQGLRQGKGNDGAETMTTTTYAHATIAAEPELVPRFEGLPVSSDPSAAQDGAEAKAEQGTGVEEPGRKKKGLSEEEEKRRRKERDERELIMDRLLEEERAQEDAYGRVALLKNRIQMLKQKRELAKAKGGKKAEDIET